MRSVLAAFHDLFLSSSQWEKNYHLEVIRIFKFYPLITVHCTEAIAAFDKMHLFNEIRDND